MQATEKEVFQHTKCSIGFLWYRAKHKYIHYVKHITPYNNKERLVIFLWLKNSIELITLLDIF